MTCFVSTQVNPDHKAVKNYKWTMLSRKNKKNFLTQYLWDYATEMGTTQFLETCYGL